MFKSYLKVLVPCCHVPGSVSEGTGGFWTPPLSWAPSPTLTTFLSFTSSRGRPGPRSTHPPSVCLSRPSHPVSAWRPLLLDPGPRGSFQHSPEASPPQSPLRAPASGPRASVLMTTALLQVPDRRPVFLPGSSCLHEGLRRHAPPRASCLCPGSNAAGPPTSPKPSLCGPPATAPTLHATPRRRDRARGDQVTDHGWPPYSESPGSEGQKKSFINNY